MSKTEKTVWCHLFSTLSSRGLTTTYRAGIQIQSFLSQKSSEFLGFSSLRRVLVSSEAKRRRRVIASLEAPQLSQGATNVPTWRRAQLISKDHNWFTLSVALVKVSFGERGGAYSLKSFFGKCYEKMPSSTTTININISNLANNNKEVLILIQQAIVII